MTAGLEDLLDGTGLPGVVELRQTLRELLSAAPRQPRLIEQVRLKRRVHRLRIAGSEGTDRSLIVKLFAPDIAQRNEAVARRWLPEVGLESSGPALLAVAAARNGQNVWHVYEDLGECSLTPNDIDPGHVRAAVRLIARIHSAFAEHPLLAEARLWGGDLGMGFYCTSVRDATRSLETLRPPLVEITSDRAALCHRLLRRLHKLADETVWRTQVMADFAGPETLLHGDLWRSNAMVWSADGGLRTRLIDWDHASVGPASYDLSTFLSRFGAAERTWILEEYRSAMLDGIGCSLPQPAELNILFDTAENARVANRVIWAALLVRERPEDWAWDDLARVEQWFEVIEPALIPTDGVHAA